MVTISLVIPAWNSGRFIKEAIESALAQTCPPHEIIIVNDGSSDDTERVVDGIRAPVAIRYYARDHAGVSVARNFGVSVARGEWIAFLDADDQWYPDKLAAQAAYIEAHPEVALVYSLMAYMDEQGDPVPAPLAVDALGPLLYRGQPGVWTSTVLLRKSVFDELNGFTPGIRVHEDNELFARIARRSPVHCLPRRLVQYRLREGQASRDVRLYAEGWSRFYRFCVELWGQDELRQTALMHETWLVYGHVMRELLADMQLAAAEHCRRHLAALWIGERAAQSKLRGKTSRLYFEIAREAIVARRFVDAQPLLRQAWLLRPLSIRRLFSLLVVRIPRLREWYGCYIAAQEVG